MGQPGATGPGGRAPEREFVLDPQGARALQISSPAAFTELIARTATPPTSPRRTPSWTRTGSWP